MYEHIDMKKTGLLLKYRIEKAVQYMEMGSDLSLNEISSLGTLHVHSRYIAGLRE